MEAYILMVTIILNTGGSSVNFPPSLHKSKELCRTAMLEAIKDNSDGRFTAKAMCLPKDSLDAMQVLQQQQQKSAAKK